MCAEEQANRDPETAGQSSITTKVQLPGAKLADSERKGQALKFPRSQVLGTCDDTGDALDGQSEIEFASNCAAKLSCHGVFGRHSAGLLPLGGECCRSVVWR